MSDNFLKMLGFKCFICSMFLWLLFSSPQDIGGSSIIDSQVDNITSSNNKKHQTLIVDGHFETNQATWSFKTFKTPYFSNSLKVSQPTAESYDYKLLYLEIGNSIPLKFTTRRLMFPFHFFT